MKLNELVENKGLFAIFAEYFATDFATIFGDTTAATLDTWTALKYGTRLVIDGINTENYTEFATAVINVNLYNWLQIAAALNSEITPTGNAETRAKTGTIRRENRENSTTLDAAKAFNDTDFVDSDRNTATNNCTNIDTYNVTETVNKGNLTKFEEISKQINLRTKQNLFDTIAADLVNELTLRIY